MALRCKPGDLAYVVSAPGLPELKNRVVEVVRLYREGEKLCGREYRVLGLPSWVCRAASPLPGRHVMYGELHWVPERAIPDNLLRPIGGAPVDEEIADEVAA